MWWRSFRCLFAIYRWDLDRAMWWWCPISAAARVERPLRLWREDLFFTSVLTLKKKTHEPLRVFCSLLLSPSQRASLRRPLSTFLSSFIRPWKGRAHAQSVRDTRAPAAWKLIILFNLAQSPYPRRRLSYHESLACPLRLLVCHFLLFSFVCCSFWLLAYDVEYDPFFCTATLWRAGLGLIPVVAWASFSRWSVLLVCTRTVHVRRISWAQRLPFS